MRKFVLSTCTIASLAIVSAAQATEPMLAAITGKGVCTAAIEGQASKQAAVNLIRTGSGARLLEVENEDFKARGAAVQVENKRSGQVAYFMDFGSTGSIVVEFSREGGRVKARLLIHKGSLPGAETEQPQAYAYDCVKKGR